MRVPRIYQPVALAPGQSIELDSQATAHLTRVLRLKPGDALVVFNGDGGEYPAVLTRMERRAVVIEIGAPRAVSLESPLPIVLVQGISRGERMDYTVQKAVELGVSHIVPVITERTVVNISAERQDKRQAHWQAIVNGACEQCGRNRVPEVTPIQRFAQWLDTQPQGGGPGPGDVLRLVLHHQATLTLTPDTPAPRAVLLLVGPEGGLSSAELAAASARGFQALRLGPRVLRTETAALVALSVIQHRWGDV